MRDSGTSISPLVLVQTTDGNWPVVFRDTPRKQRAGGHSQYLAVCAAPGDIYTPHPTLYYYLSNSLTALAELLTVFLHKGLGSVGEEQRAAMLGGTKCACACGRCVCVCRALWFPSTTQQATDLQLPIQRTDSV